MSPEKASHPREQGDQRSLRDTTGESSQTRWLRAILAAIHDGMLVFDATGRVLEMNEPFTDLFGYDLSEGPIVPPYPWWPTAEEDAEGLAAISTRHSEALAGREGAAEFRFFTRDRNPVWITSADAVITDDDGQVAAVVRTFRNVSRQKAAQLRRAAAARVSADLAAADDLATLLSVAQHGFELLFNGGSTTELDVGERYLFAGGRRITAEDLSDATRASLDGTISADAITPRPGILLVPQHNTVPCRVWVQFRRPRPIDPDEMIAADLLAQAFGLAVDRMAVAQQAVESQANLQQAIESHRAIGQAVGILVERTHVQPSEAFERLRQASQTRNVKLRELASRVVETGQDPEVA